MLQHIIFIQSIGIRVGTRNGNIYLIHLEYKKKSSFTFEGRETITANYILRQGNVQLKILCFMFETITQCYPG